jgi:hypothetical protein
MELALNLGWTVLATLMFVLWMHYAPREGTDQKTQLVALMLVIVILFPVISVTDDIVMAMNPGETDYYQRKDHVCANAHSAPHSVVGVTQQFAGELSSESVYFAEHGNLVIPTVKVPALNSIQNRPPPAA